MGDLKKMLLEANSFIRSAETSIQSGKYKEAIETLKKAEDLGKEISQSISTDPGVKALFQKIEKLKKDLEKAGIKQTDGSNVNIPFEVQTHINRIKNLLVSVPNQPYLLDQVKSELNSYLIKYPGYMSQIPEIKEIQSQIDEFERNIKFVELDEKTKKEVKIKEEEQFCNTWYKKLKSIPYFDGESTHISTLLEQKNSYYKAFELIKEFESQNFKGIKTKELENIENDIKMRISNFQEKYNNSVNLIVKEVKQKILDKLNLLKDDTTWQNDPKAQPYYLEKNNINELRNKLEELKPLFEDMTLPNELNSLFMQLMDLNEIRKSRIVLKET